MLGAHNRILLGHTPEYYLAAQWSITWPYNGVLLGCTKEEILAGSTVGMKLEGLMLSEISQPQKDKYCVTPLRSQRRRVGQRWPKAAGRGTRELVFGGDRVSVCKGDKVRETDDEDGYTATWIYVTPLNDTLQNGSQGKVCDTYFTTRSTTYTVDETWSIFTLDVKGACVIHELGHRGCSCLPAGTKGTGNPIACPHGVGAAECQMEAGSVEK